MRQQTILITGVAGFIGSSLAKSMIAESKHIIGIDNFYQNYTLRFKKEAISSLIKQKKFTSITADIRNQQLLQQIFKKFQPEAVVHLAALTGVRKSVSQPELYKDVNARGTATLFKVAAKHRVQSFVFSSSSSIYGNSKRIPFSEGQSPDPQSPYALSKVLAERMLKKLHLKTKMPTTILRFFSVYGPFGRPDMAPYLFTKSALTGEPVTFFGKGDTARDYTYIDDVVLAIRQTQKVVKPWRILNVGSSSPVSLSELVRIIENQTRKKLLLNKKPEQKEEARITFADTRKIHNLTGWSPKISFVKGMKKFIAWYQANRI